MRRRRSVIFGFVTTVVMIASLLSAGLPSAQAATPPRRIYALTPSNVLIRFNSTTPGSVTTIGAVSGLGVNQTLRGIEFRPRTGQLYGSAVTTGSALNSAVFTYRIDPATAQATFIGATGALAGAGDVPSGYDFSPTVDRIRYVNTNDENSRFNPNNGTLAGNDTDLTPAATTTVIAQAYDRSFDRQTFAAPTNNVVPSTLYSIDRNDSQVAIQGGIGGTPSTNGGVTTDLAPLGFTLNAANDGGFDIAHDGKAFAALTNAADNLTRLYSIKLPTAVTATAAATAVGLIGNGATEVRSIAVVPEGIVAFSGDTIPTVKVLDAVSGDPAIATRFPYGRQFTGGVRVAVGDINADGVPDVVTGPRRGGESFIHAFNGRTGARFPGAIGSFRAFGQFAGGVFVAAGDVNGDGFDEIIVAADAGRGPVVRVVNGRTGTTLRKFAAYPSSYTGGVRVAAGDVNLDGFADIITATGAGTARPVRVFSGVSIMTGNNINNSLFNFFPYGAYPQDGVLVAAGDVNGDGAHDIITGLGRGQIGRVKVFSGANRSLLKSFLPFGAQFRGGVRVGVGDVNDDGRREIGVAMGVGGGTVRYFDGKNLARRRGLVPFGPRYTDGIYLGG